MRLCCGFLRSALILPLLLAECDALAQSTPAPSGLTAEEVIARVSPSVALIQVGDSTGKAPRLGSGLLIRSDGIILTAYHLVKEARSIEVRLKNGEIYDKAELVAFDERRDVTALRISARGLPVLPVAKADEAKPGETVYVVSNPGGLSWTASAGILSALRLADEVPGAGTGYRLLQFTAPVSPGSSGGALVDAQARALGIVVGSSQGQNINFAVPIESVLGLAEGSGRTIFGPGGVPRAAQPEGPPATASVAKDQPAEILRLVRTVYIAGTKLFPPEPLEKKLFEEHAFRKGLLVVVKDRERADLLIELDRKEWTWDFTFRITHPATGIVVGSGKVIAWDGVRAAPGIADQIMKRLIELRPDLVPEKKKQ